jgi:hypothetical protein
MAGCAAVAAYVATLLGDLPGGWCLKVASSDFWSVVSRPRDFCSAISPDCVPAPSHMPLNHLKTHLPQSHRPCGLSLLRLRP